MCRHADKNSAYAAIVFRSRQKVNLRAACLGRARSVNTDDDLENVMWIGGLGGEEGLPAASYALHPNLITKV